MPGYKLIDMRPEFKIHLFHILFIFLTISIADFKAQEPTSVKIGDKIYGATADKRGPIGGGSAYSNIVTTGKYVVKTLEELVDALKIAQAGETVFIPGETEIDMTTLIYIEKLVLEIPSGVTLAGERGNNGSRGAILTSDIVNTPVMIRIGGPGVRVTGIRLQGPCHKRYADHHRRAFGPGGEGSSYYYKFPTSNGISCQFPNLEVDNCDISGFANAGIRLLEGDGHVIHHNFIHHCQYNGLGYGVSLNIASAVIEYNFFNWNRHSIAGTGRPGCSYTARNNVELGESSDHCFDMHGGESRNDGTKIAGTSISIYSNTFQSTQNAVDIRGIPEKQCDIYKNWFVSHTQPDKAVRSRENTIISDNVYGTDPKVIP